MIIGLIKDLTVDFPFLKANLGLSRKQILVCWLKGLPY